MIPRKHADDMVGFLLVPRKPQRARRKFARRALIVKFEGNVSPRGFDHARRDELRHGKRAHPASCSRRVDIRHRRIRRAKVDAHDVAAGSFDWFGRFVRYHAESYICSSGKAGGWQPFFQSA